MITGERNTVQIFSWVQQAPQGGYHDAMWDSFSVRPHGRTLVIHNAIGQVARRNNHELPKKA